MVTVPAITLENGLLIYGHIGHIQKSGTFAVTAAVTVVSILSAAATSSGTIKHVAVVWWQKQVAAFRTRFFNWHR